MENVRILSKHFTTGFYALVDPIGKILESVRVHPDAVTIAGLLFSIFSGLFFWKGFFIGAGFALILSGACDVLDGRLARNTNRITPFGALFDSTMDRYSEAAVFMGLAAFFNSVLISLVIILAITGSLLTSYTRARAEGLGIECKIGLMQRPERITFLATAAILGGLIDHLLEMPLFSMKLALILIAILANITVLQRVVHVGKKLKSQ
jgi:CDP-diacylglycerol---glycerol-3-phosphate 3-phosphatidyltransferase